MNNNDTRIPRRRKRSRAPIIVLIVILVIVIGAITAFALMSRKPDVNNTVPWLKDNKEDNPSITRNSQSYNFLVCGKDNVGLNTDVMMLINLNLKKDSITIMQLPRDTFITIDSSPKKLNSVYSIFYNSSNASSDEDRCHEGMKGLVKTLSDNLTINIDYYAILELQALGNIVDAIGGVDINIQNDMKYPDPDQDLYIDLKKGYQTLNGDQAQQFVRFRSGYMMADLARQDAQKMFMSAFIDSFKSKISINNIGTIVSTIFDNLTHSLTLNDCLYFAKEAYSIDFSNITMLSAPNSIYDGDTSYVILQRKALYNIINANFNLFDSPIPEESFDPDYNFTLLTNSEINKLYNSTAEFDGQFNADEINKNGIDITWKK